MLTHDNANFPSDVFTMMSAIGALVVVGMVTLHEGCRLLYRYVSVAVLADGVEQFSLWDFLKADMTNSVSVQCSYHSSCEGS